MEFIRKNLESVISILDRVKVMRFDPKMLKKYDGTSSWEIFWEWLWSIVYGYRIAQLGGPDHDEERLFILDSLLEGQAKLWFQYRLDRPNKPIPSFLEMVINIYNRFIHDSALQDTRQAFKDAKWDDADKSVEGWKDLLKKLVDEIDIAPDKYVIKSKFMEGLPQHIQLHIFTDKMSIEYNDLNKLYQAGLDVEYALWAERCFAKSVKPVKGGESLSAQKSMEYREQVKTKTFGPRRWFDMTQPVIQHATPAGLPKLYEKQHTMEKKGVGITRPAHARLPETKGLGNRRCRIDQLYASTVAMRAT